jgi:hypothetical protein
VKGARYALSLASLAALSACSTDPSNAPTWPDGAVIDPDSGALPPGSDAAIDPGPPPCADDLAWFQREVWTPILAVRCAGCHNAEGPAQNTRMVFQPATQAGWQEHNFRATRTVALMDIAGTSNLLLRPSGMHPMGHTGGTLVTTVSTEYATLSRFIARVRTPECDDPSMTTPDPTTSCTQVTPGLRQLRRLTPTEYDLTVRDLLGVESRHAENFVADPVVGGFDNNAAALVVSPVLADQLRTAAEALATEALRTPTRIIPCAPASATDMTCARTFIETFGRKAFRRPLTMTETQRYLALHMQIATGEGFNEGAEAVVTAMLQSPNFLYRSELGTADANGYRLTAWEVASELSYLLWQSMPDDALFMAAQSGGLDTAQGIEAQARRLLASPRARPALRAFVHQWLDVERLATVPKDATAFPTFSTALRGAMRDELDRFVDDVIFRPNGRFPDLLTAPYTFVNPALASFYNLTPDATSAADAAGFRRASTVEAQRRGILTLGGVMATHARPNSSSPIHRGKLVRERLLCQELPPPPPGINAQPPPLDARQTIRQQYVAHAQMHPCVDCHRLIDPVGFAFEWFDGVGRFRAMENGRAIDSTGEIVGSARTDATFADARGLIDTLAMSPEVHDCFARQLFRYAYAVEESQRTACALAQVQERFRTSNLSVPELVVALTQSPHFTRRAGDAPPPTADAGVTADASTADVPTATRDAGGANDAGSPDAGGTTMGMMTPGVTVTATRDSSWETGFCERVTVTNTTSARVDWVVTHNIAGRVTQNWNSERTGDSGAVVFRGAAWNRTLDPRGTAEFGFCAAR